MSEGQLGIQEKVHEDPYFKANQTREERTFSLLADVTLPMSIIPLMEQKYKSPSFTEERATEIRNMPTMIKLRDKALELFSKYTLSGFRGQSTTDSYFGRRAEKLHEQMLQYVEKFLKYGAGWIRIDNLDRPVEDIMSEIKEELVEARKIVPDKKPNPSGKKYFSYDICFDRPDFWDRDIITISENKEGEMLSLSFDEFYDHTKYCFTPSQLKEAMDNGAELTPYQRDIVQKAEEEKEDLNKAMSPIVVFADLIPQDITRKIKKRPINKSFPPAMIRKPLNIHARLHDYGNYELEGGIDDVQGLSEDEKFQIIEAYVKALQEFPRIKRVKR